jgi:hypothetical protein
MMQLASMMVRLPSTSTGKRFRGQSASSSRITPSCSSMRYSKGVPFSYSAMSTFWQYDENGWA